MKVHEKLLKFEEDHKFQLALVPKKLFVVREEARDHFHKGQMGVGLACVLNDLDEILEEFGY